MTRILEAVIVAFAVVAGLGVLLREYDIKWTVIASSCAIFSILCYCFIIGRK